MIKLIVVSLIALSLTACITVEVPAPEYPELPEVVDTVTNADTLETTKEASKPVSNNAQRSTPQPADTPLPAATVHPGKRRPDTSQMVVIGNFSDSDLGISISEMFQTYEDNIHLAEKVFDDKWIWFAGPEIERVERNRLLVNARGDDTRLYARFPPNAGLEDVDGWYVSGLLCFNPTYTERNDIRTITVSDCEIIKNPLDTDE